VIDNREHSAKEQKVARLNRLDVTYLTVQACWELNTKVLQPVFCTAWVRPFIAHHRPMCVPLSTCSTSPVT
jgi:hypothetical protein